MTKAIRVLFASLVFATALLAGAQDAVRVDVPFDFHVNGAVLSAGTYTVTRVFERDNALLRISAVQGKESVSFLTNLAESDHSGASLLFHRYGDVYFLSGVRTPDGKFTVRASRQERMAAVKGGGEEVVSGSR